MSEELRDALSQIISSGYQLSADGFEFLGSLAQDELAETVKNALRVAGSSTENVTILDMKFLQGISESPEQPKREVLIGANAIVRPLASQHEAEIQVLDEMRGSPSGTWTASWTTSETDSTSLRRSSAAAWT